MRENNGSFRQEVYGNSDNACRMHSGGKATCMAVTYQRVTRGKIAAYDRKFRQEVRGKAMKLRQCLS